MSRKTINVAELRKQVNEMLADSTCAPDVRLGYCAVLETALHATGNYHGFGYLTAKEVPYKRLPGINDVDASKYTCAQKLYDVRFRNTDDSRRKYY